MIPQGQYDSLHKMVFGQPTRAVYAVMDGAMIEGLPDRLAQLAPDAACLFEGALDPMLSAAAPWLVKLAGSKLPQALALEDAYPAPQQQLNWHLTWLPEGYDPAEFSVDEVNELLMAAPPATLEDWNPGIV